jgi:hypothetical protein
MRSRKSPEEVEAGYTFSGAYIRRMVRNIGVTALRGGPKARKTPPAGESE